MARPAPERLAVGRGSTHETATRVADGVYIGGYLAASNPALLRAAGITHVLKVFPGEEGYTRHPGVAYAVIPVDDTPGADLRGYLPAALRFIRAALTGGGCVLVHCHAGISRSATVVLFYLMLEHGLTFDEALGRLKTARPQVQPNAGFARHLRAIDASLARLRPGAAPH